MPAPVLSDDNTLRNFTAPDFQTNIGSGPPVVLNPITLTFDKDPLPAPIGTPATLTVTINNPNPPHAIAGQSYRIDGNWIPVADITWTRNGVALVLTKRTGYTTASVPPSTLPTGDTVETHVITVVSGGAGVPGDYTLWWTATDVPTGTAYSDSSVLHVT